MKKSKNLIVFLTILALSGWQCKSSKTTKIIFINNCAIKIDSVLLYLNNYKYKINTVPPFTSNINDVFLDSIKLNNHDIIVRSEIYIKDSIFRGNYNYNDLNGDVQNQYTLTLNKDSTSILVSNK